MKNEGESWIYLRDRSHLDGLVSKVTTAPLIENIILLSPFLTEIIRTPSPSKTEEHPLDGGAVPPKVVRVDPFFIDEAPVTNKEFGKFVRATYYETEAEKFGWSFVLSSFLPNAEQLESAEVDPEAVRGMVMYL
jgi:hypothetical protein